MFHALAELGRRRVERLGVRGQDAETLAAQVLTSLALGPLSGDGSATLGAVLSHRLHLAVLHWWRSEGRRRAATRAARDSVRSDGAAGPPADALAVTEDRARVRAALARLPAAEAEALRLAYFTSLSMENIRRQLGYRNLNVLYVRLSQARAHLRAILSENLEL